MNNKELAKTKAVNAFEQAVTGIKSQIASNTPIDWTKLLSAKTAMDLANSLETTETCAICKTNINSLTMDYTLFIFSSIIKHHYKSGGKEALARGINGIEVSMCEQCALPFVDSANKITDSLFPSTKDETMVISEDSHDIDINNEIK